MNAALAAQRGYQCEERVLETPLGFFEVFGGVEGAAGAATATRGLGESWDICTDMAIKLVPGGHHAYAIAEAAANAARARKCRRGRCREHHCHLTRPGMTKLTGPVHPRDLIDMAHSPAYFVAAGAADQAFSWEHASAAKIADPVIHRLIDTACRSARRPPRMPRAIGRARRSPSATHDGRRVSSTVFAPKGAAALGIDWRDVDAAKYRALVPAAGVQASTQIEAEISRIIHDFRPALGCRRARAVAAPGQRLIVHR